MATPGAEILDFQDGVLPRVTIGMMGLTGAMGVMPRLYTEAVTSAMRARSAALHDYLDMLGHRMVAAFAEAGTKYRLDRSAESRVAASGSEPIAQVLLSYAGFGTPGLVPRLAAGEPPLLHYAGLFSARPRSADRLQALVSDWLGRPVEVRQFAGAWLALAVDQRTALPVAPCSGAWNRLGVDAAIGIRAHDPQGRIVLRVGPLDRKAFAALLPNRSGLKRLVSLVRAYVGFEIGFAINPVHAAADVPCLPLGGGAHLGWNSWLTLPETATRPRDADDAVFEAEIVEVDVIPTAL
jgi:type VI secretion system protein ImpH